MNETPTLPDEENAEETPVSSSTTDTLPHPSGLEEFMKMMKQQAQQPITSEQNPPNASDQKEELEKVTTGLKKAIEKAESKTKPEAAEVIPATENHNDVQVKKPTPAPNTGGEIHHNNITPLPIMEKEKFEKKGFFKKAWGTIKTFWKKFTQEYYPKYALNISPEEFKVRREKMKNPQAFTEPTPIEQPTQNLP